MNSVTTVRARTTLGALVLASCTLLSGCLKSTGPQESLLDLAGDWHYTGDQAPPVSETLVGTLTITRESGVSFQGKLVLQAVNEQTQLPRTLTGAVSGSESGTGVIDFDATIESNTRRHVGTIQADTIEGTWVSPSDHTMSGTFRAVRETR